MRPTPRSAARQTRLVRERRFLLPTLPRALSTGTAALIEERYLAGTGLCLRRSMSPSALVAGGGPELTLGQQVRAASDRTARVTLTERLSSAEFDAFAKLPAHVLVWRRYDIQISGWPCAVDEFEGELSGLVVAEAAFRAADDAWSFRQPPFAVAEITGDSRFGEEALARTTAVQLSRLVSEYGMLLRR